MQDWSGRTEEERKYYALNRRVYRLFARFYDRVTFPAQHLRRRVVKLARPAPGSLVLDAASGTGAQAFAFAEAGCHVIGVDISEEMLRKAHEKNHFTNLVFELADACALPFDADTFDISSISFALHEMPKSVRTRVLSELCRVTKPEGKIVIVDYALPRKALRRRLVRGFVRIYEHAPYTELIASDLRAQLAESGVAVEEEHVALIFGAGHVLIGKKVAGKHALRSAA
jgi:ubiquinone/menaquinone biosynthesis C-methylase UbiE